MPLAQSIATRVPQRGDTLEALVARGLKSSSYGHALALATRSVSTFSSDIETTGFSTLIYRLNITNFGGGTGVAPIIQMVDPTTGQASTLASVALLTGLGWWFYAVGRGIGTLSGMSSGLQGYAALPLPSIIRCGLIWGSPNFHDLEVTYELVP
jgi:hypothetical protein